MRNRPKMQPIARFFSFAAIDTTQKPKPYRMNYGVLESLLTLIIDTERAINLCNILPTTTKYRWQYFTINCTEGEKIYCLI